MLSAQMNKQQATQSSNNTNSQGSSQTSKQSTGTVTKILDNFGFIDDTIFFPLSVVKGTTQVKVGDKVYFECSYSKNLPFNWNATVVQPLASSSSNLNNQQQQTPSSILPQQQQQRQPTSQFHNLSHSQTHSIPPSQGLSLQQQHLYQQQPTVPSAVTPQSTSLNQTQTSATTQHSNMYHQQHPHHQQPQQQGPGPNSGLSSQPSGYHPGYPMQQSQQQQQNKQMTPQYGGVPQQSTASQIYNSAPYNVGGPQQPTPSVSQTQVSSTAPQTHVDMVKVQQAVAQLTQFYNPTANTGQQQPGRQDSSIINHHQQQQITGATSGSNHQYGVGGGGSAGSVASGAPIQYTSTPGAAFIGSQYNPNVVSGNQNKPPVAGGHGAGQNRVPGKRWDHPRDDPSQQQQQNHRFDQGGPGKIRPSGDPRMGSRFGKSRFHDSEGRFGQGANQMNEDRFAPNKPTYGTPSQDLRFPRTVGPRTPGGDMLRKDSDSRFNRGDKDQREFRDRSRDRDSINNRMMDRDNKDRLPMNRDRGRDRDRDSRPSNRLSNKRSLSPSPSVASSTGTASATGGTANSRNAGLNFLPKRRYEPCNIPKTNLIKNRYNSVELKSKVDSSVHIPSDLKEVLCSMDVDFDLSDIPKPILFKIFNEKDNKDKDSKSQKKTTNTETPEKLAKSETEKNKSKSEDKKQQSEENKAEENETDKDSKETEVAKEESSKAEDHTSDKTQQQQDESMSTSDDVKQEEKEDVTQPETISKEEEEEIEKDQEEPTGEENDPKLKSEEQDLTSQMETDSQKAETANISSKESQSSESHSRGKHHGSSTSKTSNHKFNVKVLLISLPSMTEIYERLFGSEFANVPYTPGSSSSTQNSTPSKNQVSHFNKLFSMLVTRNSNDGYSLIGGKYIKELDGYLPGSNQEPNLVQAAIRIVWEQTGLNLSTCRQWRVFSTFIYNRDSSININECGYEITKIYFPDIWSALDFIYQPLPSQESESKVKDSPKIEAIDDDHGKKLQKIEIHKNQDILMPSSSTNTTVMPREEKVFIRDVPNNEKKKYLQNLLASIDNFKVYELKNELEKMGIKYESRLKKEQLYQQLNKVVQDYLKILDGEEPKDVTIGNDEEIMMNPDESMMEIGQDDQKTKIDNDVDDQKKAPKRKLDDNDDNQIDNKEQKEEILFKKSKPNEENVTKNDDEQEQPTISALSSNIKAKGSNLTLLSLHSALNPHRFDQFELSVIAEFLRDSLTIHFVHYIYSSLVHQIKLHKPIIPQQLSSSSSSSGSSAVTTETARTNIPANYCHLAFSYFDKGHCGYMPSDDLNTLMNMTGFSISKKCFNSLVSSLMSLANINTSISERSILNERILYIFFQQPTTLIPRQINYPTIMGYQASSDNIRTLSSSDGETKGTQLIVERNSTQYNVDELIKQSEADQKIKVRLNDSLTDCTKKIAQLESQIQELDAKQKKMSAATGRQNDELCAVKRERDQIKSKYEQLKKFWLKATNEFNSIMKTLEKPTPGQPQLNNTNPNIGDEDSMDHSQSQQPKVSDIKENVESKDDNP